MKKTLFCTEIERSHYVRDLLTKMLKAEPGERISSIQVVKELKDIKIEVFYFEFWSNELHIQFVFLC